MILRKIPVQEGEQFFDYGVYCGRYEFISTCDICGTKFQHEYRHARYCSARCEDIANIQNRKAYRQQTNVKICEHCGETFQATRIDSLFCSAACRQANHRDKQKQEKPPEQTTLYVIKWKYYVEKLVKELYDNNIECVLGFRFFSASEIRKFAQYNIQYIQVHELDIPFELGRAIRTKEISQAEYETKYKKHLQTLKLGLEIDKTVRVAVSVEDTSGYYEYKEKCYTVILPEFIKKSLGLKKIINM